MIIVTKFQILVRTGTAGGPEGPPLIFFLRSFSNMPKPYLPYGKQIQKLINDKVLKEESLKRKLSEFPVTAFWTYQKKYYSPILNTG